MHAQISKVFYFWSFNCASDFNCVIATTTSDTTTKRTIARMRSFMSPVPKTTLKTNINILTIHIWLPFRLHCVNWQDQCCAMRTQTNQEKKKLHHWAISSSLHLVHSNRDLCTFQLIFIHIIYSSVPFYDSCSKVTNIQ